MLSMMTVSSTVSPVWTMLMTRQDVSFTMDCWIRRKETEGVQISFSCRQRAKRKDSALLRVNAKRGGHRGGDEPGTERP